jgi:hypothetical protein
MCHAELLIGNGLQIDKYKRTVTTQRPVNNGKKMCRVEEHCLLGYFVASIKEVGQVISSVILTYMRWRL